MIPSDWFCYPFATPLKKKKILETPLLHIQRTEKSVLWVIKREVAAVFDGSLRGFLPLQQAWMTHIYQLLSCDGHLFRFSFFCVFQSQQNPSGCDVRTRCSSCCGALNTSLQCWNTDALISFEEDILVLSRGNQVKQRTNFD